MPAHNTITGGRSVNTGDRPSALTRLFYTQNSFKAEKHKNTFYGGAGMALELVGAINNNDTLIG